MSYRAETAEILVWAGYDDSGFDVSENAGVFDIERWDLPDPQPTEAEVDALYPGWKRETLAGQINAQTLQPSARDLAVDPVIEADTVRYESAAEDRRLALSETDDAGLEAFDPTIDVKPPQDDFAYSRVTLTIEQQEPWAGAPDNNLGFAVVLQVEKGQEASGDEARVYVVDAPSDVTAVLPLVQDPANADGTDSQIWRAEARDGHKWSDPNVSCTLQILWGAGSLPVSAPVTCNGIYDRKAVSVRYGVAAATT